jgi:nucleosome binding factor SPN SPT16 subunit
LVILHFNLINPIVVGKRKTSDIQFVQETMEASSRLDSRKHAFGDADEIEEEQREKAARKKINRTFFKFCKDVEEFAKKNDPEGEEVFKFDFPSRELGFNGVPFKSHVFLQPTAHDCLVHLVEGPPFFVMSLDDVEVASFERVRFGLRQFDLIFILKDYSKDPITINSIPVEALETLQEWLSKSNILFYVNPQPYNWNNLMQEIRAKPLKQFLDEGGWSFLGREESDEEKEGGGGEAMEEGSEEYEPEGSSSESDFEDEDDGDDDDDGGGGDDDDDEDGGDDDEEEEAEDWDELERKAEASDKKRWGETKKTVQLPVGKKAKKSD